MGGRGSGKKLPDTSPSDRSITTKVPHPKWRLMDRAAAAEGVTVSALARRFIYEGIARLEREREERENMQDHPRQEAPCPSSPSS